MGKYYSLLLLVGFSIHANAQFETAAKSATIPYWEAYSQSVQTLVAARAKALSSDLKIMGNEERATAGRFAKQLTEAKKAVAFAKETYSVSKMIYQTGVSTVEMAKRAGGDFAKMSDFQNYNTFFNLMVSQQFESLNNSHEKLLDFQKIYNATTDSYRTNGVIDPFKILKEGANNTLYGNQTYTQRMIELVGMESSNQRLISAAKLQEAAALEKQAFELERLANKFQFYLNLTMLGGDREALNKWYTSATDIGIGRGYMKAYKNEATGETTYKEYSAVKNVIDAPSDFLDSELGKTLRSEIEKFRKDHDITGQSIADFSKTVNDYRFQSAKLRKRARLLRAEAYESTKMDYIEKESIVMYNELLIDGKLSELYGF